MAPRALSILNLVLAFGFAAFVIAFHAGLTGPTPGAISSRYPTMIAPFEPARWVAFAVAGLGVAFAVHQSVRARRDSSFLGRVRPWSALAFVAAITWLAFAQYEIFLNALGAGVVLLGALAVIVAICARSDRPLSGAERWLVFGTFSLFLGWATLAVVETGAQMAVSYGYPSVGVRAETLSVALISGVTLCAIAVSLLVRGNLAFAAGVAIPLIGIAASQMAGWSPLKSSAVGVFAALAALLALLGPVIARLPSLRPSLPRPVQHRQSLA